MKPRTKTSGDKLAVLLAESAVLQAEMDAHARAAEALDKRGHELAHRGTDLAQRLAALPCAKNNPRVKSLLASLLDLARGA